MYFFKKYLFVLVIFFTVLKIDASEVQVQTVLPEPLRIQLENFEYTLDAYKNIAVKLDSPSSKEIDKLRAVITEMRKCYKNYGLYVQISVSQGEFANRLESLGFKFCDLNTQTKTLIYLYPNGRNIPELNYAYTAAAVYLLRRNPETGTNEILIVNDPQETVSNIPGGCSAKGEAPEDTVARETYEETGIMLNKEKLKLVAVFHTVRDDKKCCVEFVYVCDEFKGTPKVNGVTVTNFTWVPLSEILKDGVKIFGKPFYLPWQKVLSGAFKNQEYSGRFNSTKKIYQHFSTVEGGL